MAMAHSSCVYDVANERKYTMLIHHLFEGADYESMIRIFDELDVRYAPIVRQEIDKARRFLRRNDQMVWYIRWLRIAMLYRMKTDAWHDGDQAQQEKVEAILDRITAPMIAKGIRVVHDENFDTARRRDNMLNDLLHFSNIPTPAIQNFRFGWETFDAIKERFQAAENEWKKDRAGTVVPRPGDKIVVQVGNGVAWWLLDRGECSDEANAMGHCGNAGAMRGDRILSLRREIRKGDVKVYAPDLTFILQEDGFLGEMKGRGNDKPAARYHDAIIALLKNPLIKGIRGGGYAPKNNFDLRDLSSEKQDDLFAVRRDLMPMSIQFEKEGINRSMLVYVAKKCGAGSDRYSLSLNPDTMYDPETGYVRFIHSPSVQGFAKKFLHFQDYQNTDGNPYCVQVKKFLDTGQLLEESEFKSGVIAVVVRASELHPESYPKVAKTLEGLLRKKGVEAPSRGLSPEELGELSYTHSILPNTFSVIIHHGMKTGTTAHFRQLWTDWLNNPKTTVHSRVKSIRLVEEGSGLYVTAPMSEVLIAIEKSDFDPSDLVVVRDIPYKSVTYQFDVDSATNAFVRRVLVRGG